MGILDKILENKRQELPELRSRKLPAAPPRGAVLDFKRSPGEPLHFFCEIKRRSPSGGQLSTALTVAERARKYEEAGASMISVLCDGPFFGGSYEDLRAAREAQSVPVLCKEFVIDECQIDCATAYGASAILLIVRCLDDRRLREFINRAQENGLAPLVEVFNEDEKDRALDAGATMIGVNARDLDTLRMDTTAAQTVLKSLPAGITACHLSGVKTPDDVERLAKGRADAALIGEILMRQDDPLPLLRTLLSRTG